MASYRLLIKPSAAKELEGLPLTDRRRVVARMQGLSAQPRPPGCEKLTGHDLFRVRQGKYRIVYQVQDHDLTVIIYHLQDRSSPRRLPLILSAERSGSAAPARGRPLEPEESARWIWQR